VTEGGSVLPVPTGSLRRQFPAEWDLCRTCSEAYAAFMLAGRQASQDGPGEARGDGTVNPAGMAAGLV
jgi:hypothetical protein